MGRFKEEIIMRFKLGDICEVIRVDEFDELNGICCGDLVKILEEADFPFVEVIQGNEVGTLAVLAKKQLKKVED